MVCILIGCPMGKYGFSFSWRRASGLSALKGRVSRQIGIPLTRSGRERKAGRMLLGLLALGGGRRSDARSTSSGGGGGTDAFCDCPHCGQKHRVRADSEGLIKRCNACDKKFTVQCQFVSAKQLGCLARLGRMIAAATLLAIMIAIIGLWAGRSDSPSVAPPTGRLAEPHRRPPAPPREPSLTATPPAQDPVTREITDRTPAVPATGPSRLERLATAKERCLAKLHQRPDYIAAKQAVLDAEGRLKKARVNPGTDLSVPALSELWIDAKNHVSQVEAKALAEDPGVAAASN